MKVKILLAMAALAMSAAACQSIPREQTVAEYCADARRANKDVCKINVEIDGQRQALSQTNLRLSEARALAEQALSTAQRAETAAQFNCQTRTLSRTAIGSCDPGYKVMSCTQTRYTYRAGGPSILREINDEQCRFNSRVLEMQVRCCATGQPPVIAPATTADPVDPRSGTQPTS